TARLRSPWRGDPVPPRRSSALLARRRDDAAAARAYFEQATQLDASFAPAWANLGALALSYRDYEAAERNYAKALQLDPGRAAAQIGRAHSELQSHLNLVCRLLL